MDLLWFPVSQVSACGCRHGHVVKEGVYLTAAGKHREVAGRSRAKRLAFEDVPPVTYFFP